MEKIAAYRQAIKQIFTHYVEILNRRPTPNEETFVVFDEERDHYFIQTIGWDDTRRIWNTPAYVRIHHAKIWIEVDWLEQGIATDLLEMGIPKEDIVLAFHHPSMRPYTEFAVA
jgi:GNAT superfamily N-acetyltransferase